MGGTFIVRANEASWLPSAWDFDRDLDSIAETLQTKEPSISNELFAAMEGFPFMDVSGWDAPRFRSLLDGVLEVFESRVEILLDRGTIADDNNRNLFSLPMLKALMLLDSRSGSDLKDITCSIIVREDSIWTAPGWAYDYLLEQIAPRLITLHVENARLLFSSRTIRNRSQCDLSVLNARDMAVFVRVICILKKGQIDKRVMDGYSPEFNKEYFPRLPELYNLFRSDPRIVKHEDWQLYE